MSVKKIVTMIFCFNVLLLSAQKNIDQVLRKYKNDEGVINMNFTGGILKMINSSDKKIRSNVELVDIVVFQKNQDVNSEDKVEIQNVLSKDKFDLLINVKNKTQKIQLYAVDAGEYLNKVYAHVNSGDINAYFVLSGKIIFEELAKLGLDFQNGDALKILEKVGRK